MLPNEVGDILLCYLSQGLSFNPLIIVVNRDYNILELPSSYRKRVIEIDSPLCKGSRARDWGEIFWWLVWNGREALAFVTLTNKVK